ncbi:MAG: NTP transferase domain-containing protein [Litorilinea sp.]
MQERFDAIILAGYDPERPHAFVATHSEPHKVLIPVGGRPMLARVLDALAATPVIARCVVVGFEANPLPAAPGDDASARADADAQELHFIPNQGSIYHNLIAAFEFLGARQDHSRHVFLISADVPLLQPRHVEWFVNACAPLDKDLYMSVVEKQVMEQTFPQSTRTYVPLREGRFCNGELLLTRISAALQRQEIYADIISRRKSTLRQVQLLGPGLLLKFLLRRLALRDVLGFVRRRIRIEAAAVPLPFAETGMDVDKPSQLALVEMYLADPPKAL